MVNTRKRGYLIIAGLTVLLLFVHLRRRSTYLEGDTNSQVAAQQRTGQRTGALQSTTQQARLSWSEFRPKFPIQEYIGIPAGRPVPLPKIQASFSNQTETEDQTRARLKRRAFVKRVFGRAWTSYRKRAWLKDELQPVSGKSNLWYGGWAATLIDSLDTLWIMDMKKEFEEGVAAVSTIDFSLGSSTQELINVFETNIRHLGGLIGAYDLSGDKRLLEKAVELGNMLYASFDTPNHMPLTRWRPAYANGKFEQRAEAAVLAAEMGSFCLEFTRLTQLTGDKRYFDAAHRITNKLAEAQMKTRLPGLFNLVVDGMHMKFHGGGSFKLGAMIDSLYVAFIFQARSACRHDSISFVWLAFCQR